MCLFNPPPRFAALVQLVNLPEPVTLDFLDAEVEDSSKEEVSMKRSWTEMLSFSGTLCSRYSHSMLLLGQCTAVAPEGPSASALLYSPAKVHVTFLYYLLTGKNKTKKSFVFFRSGDK